MDPDYPHEIKEYPSMSVKEVQRFVLLTEAEGILLELMSPKDRGKWLKERREADLAKLFREGLKSNL